MKNYALGMGLALLLTMSSLPASADCAVHGGTMINSNLSAGSFNINNGDIVRFNAPLMLSGIADVMDGANTGLVHLTLNDGSHLIVPQTLSFFQNGSMISSGSLLDGANVSVELPMDYNWVVDTGTNAPFSSIFGNNVVVLGGYDGPIWVTPGALANADFELVTAAIDMMDSTADLDADVDVDLEADIDMDDDEVGAGTSIDADVDMDADVDL